jgi:hypothetical protein
LFHRTAARPFDATSRNDTAVRTNGRSPRCSIAARSFHDRAGCLAAARPFDAAVLDIEIVAAEISAMDVRIIDHAVHTFIRRQAEKAI